MSPGTAAGFKALRWPPIFLPDRSSGHTDGVFSAVLFLVVGLFFLIATLNSFRPVRRNKWLYVPSFFTAWLTNELAPFYLLITGLLTLAFVTGRDALEHPVGWVGLGAMAMSWALLWMIHSGGLKAGPVVVAALGGYGAELHPERARRRAVRRVRNVAFRRVAGRTL